MSNVQAIVVTSELAHPPEKVWRAITQPAHIERWLMANDFAPTVGHKFTFRASPMGSWDGIVHGEVLEADPPKRLRYAWVGGVDDPGGYGSRLDTVVTIELTPTASGTRLHLEHSGFLPKNASAFEMMGKGWREKIVQKIGEVTASLD